MLANKKVRNQWFDETKQVNQVVDSYMNWLGALSASIQASLDPSNQVNNNDGIIGNNDNSNSYRISSSNTLNTTSVSLILRPTGKGKNYDKLIANHFIFYI